MSHILCATRGGEPSFRTQTAAIQLAKEHNAELTFIYIVNLRFLDKTAAPIVVNIENELSQMGSFFLLVAKERAREQGVNANVLLRKGSVRQEIVKAVAEIGATIVCLGEPAEGPSSFKLSSLKAFADQITTDTGAEVNIVCQPIDD